MDSVVNCRFTRDGKYLHVATFQYHVRSANISSNSSVPDSEIQDNTSIDFIMYTYKLCAHRPTRARPALIHVHDDMRFAKLHKAKIGAKFPCTFTWTDSHLYLVWSGNVLTIHKIPLFLKNTGEGLFGGADLEIELTKRNILIPASAEEREVIFLPSADHTSGRVIVGMQITTTTGHCAKGDFLTPLDCNLDVLRDIEGWTSRTYENPA